MPIKNTKLYLKAYRLIIVHTTYKSCRLSRSFLDLHEKSWIRSVKKMNSLMKGVFSYLKITKLAYEEVVYLNEIFKKPINEG